MDVFLPPRVVRSDKHIEKLNSVKAGLTVYRLLLMFASTVAEKRSGREGRVGGSAAGIVAKTDRARGSSLSIAEYE